jgi:hypothetical protein
MAVERFKHDGEWKIIGSSSSKVQVADDKLDPESINSVQNKVITKALENKADIVDKLVNAYGIRSVSNTEYYMPDIGGVNPAHSLATKADIINSGSSENKATMYNLYAMDELSEERLEANAKALESVQNREVAIYKVYTNDDTYAIADVKIVPGPYLEAYVDVNIPNEESKQATITKYTYTFEPGGYYYTSDKEEVVVPLKEEIISNEEVIASAFNNIHIVIRDIKESILNNVTKEELQYEIEDLRSKIIANEEVIANALSDLNTKFLDLESRLIDVEKITEQ